MGICISPNTLDSGDDKQSDLRSMPGPINSTSITRGNVVSGNTVATCSNSHRTASNKNSAKAAKESSIPSKATIPKTSRLEVIRRTIEQRDFRRKLQDASLSQFENLQAQFMMQNGGSSLIGVSQGKLIHSRPLFS